MVQSSAVCSALFQSISLYHYESIRCPEEEVYSLVEGGEHLSGERVYFHSL